MNTRCFPIATIILTATLSCTSAVVAQSDKEAELIAILKSDAPKSEKAITCKHLAVHGTKHAVPELAKLLSDPQLTSWSRTALEVIPDPSADDALRSALADLPDGLPLTGVINSIATRRDEQAVDGLIKHLKSEQPQVANAAAVALGHIANSLAQQALENSLASDADSANSGVSEGCILIAERYLESGDADSAAALYEKIRNAKVPKQRELEATRGLILAGKSVELLNEQLQSDDRDRFALGLHTAREMPEQEVTEVLVAVLDHASPQRQSLIVLSLAQRDRTSVLPAILRIAATGNVSTRSSALQVLGSVGDASTLEILLAAASDRDRDVAQAAKDALATLNDPAVEDAIKKRLSSSQGEARRVLIETIGSRRIGAIAELLDATDDADPTIRAAALTALGETVGPEELSQLIVRFTHPQHTSDGETAQRALTIASTRMPDRDACATELADAMTGQSLATQSALIEILGSVGGAQALETVAKAAADDQDALKDAASRALGKWMTPDAAPKLLKLAQPKADDKYRIRALRGYLRIARQMQLAAAERAQMCDEALKLAGRDEERLLALRVLEIHPSLDSLAVALSAKQIPEIKDAAHATSLRVANRLPNQAAEVGKLLEQGGLQPAKIEILRATYGSGDQTKDVTDIVRRSVGKLPIAEPGVDQL